MTAVLTAELMEQITPWKVEFIKRFIAEHDGVFPWGEKKKFVESFADEYSLSPRTVGNFYDLEYTKNKVPNLRSIIESFRQSASAAVADQADELVELTQDEMERLVSVDPDRFVVKDGEYKKGRVVEVRVIDIRDYGVITETTDGFHTRGLIHITQIIDGFVQDTSKYFRYNDITKAMILEHEMPHNRLKLSTRCFAPKEQGYIRGGIKATQPVISDVIIEEKKPVNTLLADKLSAVKDKIVASVPVKAAAPVAERDQIKSYLNTVVGALTPIAEELMVGLVQEHGVFKFTMSMMKAAAEFRPDLGVVLMKEIDVRIGEGL